jgi:hypothetical protein
VNGPGKYDDVATVAMRMTGADGVLVCILGGVYGDGFEVHITQPETLDNLPKLLREIADRIEKDRQS